MLPKTCHEPSVLSVLLSRTDVCDVEFVLESCAESRFCFKKCYLVDIVVEVEPVTVGHNSWQKAEQA